MQSIRDAANAIIQGAQVKKMSIRAMIACGMMAYDPERWVGRASAGTIRKWRRASEERMKHARRET